MRVYKYPIKITDKQSVEMPLSGKILTAQMQGDQLCLWALVDPDNDWEGYRIIYVHGTGHPIKEENLKYIATVQTRGLVFHVFEEGGSL